MQDTFHHLCIGRIGCDGVGGFGTALDLQKQRLAFGLEDSLHRDTSDEVTGPIEWMQQPVLGRHIDLTALGKEGLVCL